jgi:hypothetical protein
MGTPGKLHLLDHGGLAGDINITYNDPWPCVNGTPGGGSSNMMGVVMHTMVGDLPGTKVVFNRPGFNASAYFGIGQLGETHQFGPIGKNWKAWAQGNGNGPWYSIELADHGNPNNPLTWAQILATAQIVEFLSRFAGFPLQVTNSTGTKGFGVHNMGGAAWGGHTCPDMPPRHVRSDQREVVLKVAHAIRSGVPHEQKGPFRHESNGNKTLEQIAQGRGVTVDQLVDTSLHASAMTRLHKRQLQQAKQGLYPEGLVYYTTTE